MTGRSILGAFIAGAVAVAVGAALVYVGSPAEARRRRFDDRRVRDLTEIANSLDRYWTTNTHLPASLEEAAQGGVASVPRDPESAEPYAYRLIDDHHYELCAVFARTSDEVPAMTDRPFARHAAGRQCFAVPVKGTARQAATLRSLTGSPSRIVPPRMTSALSANRLPNRLTMSRRTPESISRVSGSTVVM
jgi:hypothetical protein